MPRDYMFCQVNADPIEHYKGLELTDTEKKVLRLRYVLDITEKVDSTAKESLANIGKELGFSHYRASVLEQRAYLKLGITEPQTAYERNHIREIIKWATE